MSTKPVVFIMQLICAIALAEDRILESCTKPGGNETADIFSTIVKVSCSDNDVQTITLTDDNKDAPCETFLDVCPAAITSPVEAAPLNDIPSNIFADDEIDVKTRVHIPMASSASKHGDRISIVCSNKETKRKMEFTLGGTVVDRIPDPMAVQKLCEDFFANDMPNQAVIPQAAEIVPIVAEEPTTTSTTTATTTTTTSSVTSSERVFPVPQYSRPSQPRRQVRRQPPPSRQVRREPRVPYPETSRLYPAPVAHRRPARKVRVVVDLHGQKPHSH